MEVNLEILEERVRATQSRLAAPDSERNRSSAEPDRLGSETAERKEENNELSGGLPQAARIARIGRGRDVLTEAIEALHGNGTGSETRVGGP